MSELYAHEEYKGWEIFIEQHIDKNMRWWDVVICYQGVVCHTDVSYISGDKALTKAYNWINKQEES